MIRKILNWSVSLLSLHAENLALRQQLGVYKRKKPKPKLKLTDRLFWMIFSKIMPGWQRGLYIVQPETVVSWHRRGFKMFWSYISKPKRRPGRPRVSKELRDLIKKMALDNSWGAPRIHGELKKLGYSIDERTVSNYMPKFPTPESTIKNWKRFLKNHSEFICATDFFTVPTIFMRNLYIFFVIHHSSRKILHFNATFNPTEDWVIQQFREAFSGEHGFKYLIMDRDTKFSEEVRTAVKEMGVKVKRTPARKPWLNPVGERWVGSARRDVFDRVIVFSRDHAMYFMHEYARYYHEDRTHLGLAKETPSNRQLEQRLCENSKINSLPRIGGLHHRYTWNQAA